MCTVTTSTYFSSLACQSFHEQLQLTLPKWWPMDSTACTVPRSLTPLEVSDVLEVEKALVMLPAGNRTWHKQVQRHGVWGFVCLFLIEIESIIDKSIVLFVPHPDPWKGYPVANKETQIVGTDCNSNSAASNSSLEVIES